MLFLRAIVRTATVLVLGVPALASSATLNVNIPNCGQVALTGTAPNYTITCTPTMSCVAQATPLTPQAGTTVNLSVACNPAATSVTWQGSRDCSNPTPGIVGTATVAESGGRSCVYTAVANGGAGAASAAVVWQGSGTGTPPSGCTITRVVPANGTLGAGGGDISMSAACVGGGAVTSWKWRKNTNTSWSAASAPTDNLPRNTDSAPVIYNYGVTACSGGACATEVTTTFTVTGSTPSTPAGFCGSFPDVRSGDLVWGGQFTTHDNGGISAGVTYLARLVVPATATSPNNYAGSMEGVEFPDAPAERVVTLSKEPCDFRGWTPGMPVFPSGDPSGGAGPLAWSGGNVLNFSYLFVGDPPGFPPKVLLMPGQTYFINIQTIRALDGQNSCNAPSCNLKITTRTPG